MIGRRDAASEKLSEIVWRPLRLLDAFIRVQLRIWVAVKSLFFRVTGRSIDSPNSINAISAKLVFGPPMTRNGGVAGNRIKWKTIRFFFL